MYGGCCVTDWRCIYGGRHAAVVVYLLLICLLMTKLVKINQVCAFSFCLLYSFAVKGLG